MNELMTMVDLGRAVELRVLTGDRQDLEYRRQRAQGTLWMAMALDALAASTLTLEDEFMPFVLKHTTHPASEAWLTVLSNFVMPHVIPAWTILNLDARLGGHKRNDTILTDDAAQRAIPVITRDSGVTAKAAARGGKTLTPEAFASTVLPLADARRRFYDRFNGAAPAWAIELANGDVNSAITKRQCHWLKFWRIRYDYIWSDDPGSYYLGSSLGEIDL